MCEPVSATMAVMAIAGAGASMYANKETAEFQAKQQGLNTKRANAAALQAYELDTQQLGLAASQELDAAADEKLRLNLDTQKSVSTARAAGAESGLAGYSLDAQIDDFYRQGADNITTLDANLDNAQAGRQLERKSIYNSAVNRQQSFKPYQPSSGVFYTGAALQIANAGTQGYATGKSLQS